MKKVGGLCYDERTRKWKGCAQSVAGASVGGEKSRCCVNENCCVDCDAINAIRICATKNLQIFFERVDNDLGNSIYGVQLIRQWRNYSSQPGGCTLYTPETNAPPTNLLKDGEPLSCYTISEIANDAVTITPGNPMPIGLIFKANDTENCQDFALMFLIDVVPYGLGYKWKLLGSKYCLNYQDIRTENDFYSTCKKCPSPQRCQILGQDLINGGIGNDILINIGTILFSTENTVVREISIVIPECCSDTINNSNFSVLENGLFNTVTPSFSPTLPSGAGVYSTEVILSQPQATGPGKTIIVLRSNTCGTIRITINYNIV